MEMEAVKLSSDSEIDENEENVAAVGKKRGRPAKGGSKAAVVKSGRGRGRPPKDPEANAERLKLANEEKANGVGNGKQRGRPAKGGKTKLSHSIVATGKGRGRPKSANEDDGENNAVSPKKTTPGKGGRGRPKKEVSESDEERSVDGKEESPNEAEEDDDDEERRPINLEQRWQILRHYFENHGNVAECVRKLRTDFGTREAPSAPYVRNFVKKVKETGILIDKPKREKPKTVRTPENFAAVAENVRGAPSTSIHRRSQE